MTNILSTLKGGDRRSIGKVSAVVATVSKSPGLFKDLAGGLFDPDPIVRMRAADAMEKLSADDSRLLQPFKQKLVGLAQQTRQQELRWHLAQMVPRLDLTPQEINAVTDIFVDYLADNSKIVVTFAMQALCELAIKKGRVSSRVLHAIERLTQTGSPAIQARGKKLLPKLKNLLSLTG
jgi:hypothetical protein